MPSIYFTGRRVLKHGESQQNFETGAKRDTQKGKLRYDLLSPLADFREAQIMTKGAEHYGDRNWEKGMPMMRVVASLKRHFMAWLFREEDEDHLAQFTWNARALLHYDEAIKRGILPAELDDRIDYAGNKQLDDLIKVAERRETFPGPRSGDPRKTAIWDSLCRAGCLPEVARVIAEGVTFATKQITRNHDEIPFVYIAGPMRGIAEFNFPAFDKARDELISQGFHVLSPADIDRAAGDENSDDQARFAMRDFHALHFLKTCNKDGRLMLLKGWENSVGASAEYHVAKWLKMPVNFYVG